MSRTGDEGLGRPRRARAHEAQPSAHPGRGDRSDVGHRQMAVHDLRPKAGLEGGQTKAGTRRSRTERSPRMWTGMPARASASPIGPLRVVAAIATVTVFFEAEG